jgi:hypothetical protein
MQMRFYIGNTSGKSYTVTRISRDRRATSRPVATCYNRKEVRKAQQRAMVNWNLNCTLGTPDLLDGSGFDEIWNNKTYEYKDS